MEKILLVDDSEILRLELKELLLDANYEVIEATNGLEGLEVTNTKKDISMIICDYNMPKMNGIEMSRQIKKNTEYIKIPILILTTESSLELRKQAGEAGIFAWIVKPYDVNELINGIEEILSELKSS